MFQFASFSRLIFALIALLTFTAGQAYAQDDESSDYETQLTDAVIIDIAMALNQLEVTTSEPALTKATDETVRQFAQKMIDEHSKAVQTLKQFDIAPKANEISQTLRDTSKGVRDQLSKFDGTGFDRKYMEMQISLHQSALNLLDYTLIPRVEDAELRQQLIDLRMVVDDHLQQAWDVYRGLPAS